jgi:hypothetical protein
VDDQLDGDKQFGRRMVLLPLISMRAFLKEAIAMKAINYEAPAGLWKEFFGEIAPGKVAHLCSIEVARGTLRSCVAQLMRRPTCALGSPNATISIEGSRLPQTDVASESLKPKPIRPGRYPVGS